MQTALMIMIGVSLAMIFYHLLTDDECYEQFDRIEVNHVYDHFGEERLAQIIFWELGRDGMQVRDWRMLRRDHVPVKTAGQWHVYWYDEKDKKPRTSIARTYMETHTTWDREIEARRTLAADKRRLLK